KREKAQKKDKNKDKEKKEEEEEEEEKKKKTKQKKNNPKQGQNQSSSIRYKRKKNKNKKVENVNKTIEKCNRCQSNDIDKGKAKQKVVLCFLLYREREREREKQTEMRMQSHYTIKHKQIINIITFLKIPIRAIVFVCNVCMLIILVDLFMSMENRADTVKNCENLVEKIDLAIDWIRYKFPLFHEVHVFEVVLDVVLHVICKGFMQLCNCTLFEMNVYLGKETYEDKNENFILQKTPLGFIPRNAYLQVQNERVDYSRISSSLRYAHPKFKTDTHFKLLSLFLDERHEYFPNLLRKRNPVDNFNELIQWVCMRNLNETEAHFLYKLLLFPQFNEIIDKAVNTTSSKEENNDDKKGAQNRRRTILSEYLLFNLSSYLPQHQDKLRSYATKYKPEEYANVDKEKSKEFEWDDNVKSKEREQKWEKKKGKDKENDKKEKGKEKEKGRKEIRKKKKKKNERKKNILEVKALHATEAR
ncbi:hypothetical protein RFI_13579, partial [Reticulomyxa filosa]